MIEQRLDRRRSSWSQSSNGQAVMAALPLGIIPSGTGNGLAKSLLSAVQCLALYAAHLFNDFCIMHFVHSSIDSSIEQADEPYGIIEAALLIARGGVSGLDLAEVPPLLPDIHQSLPAPVS